MHQRTLEGVFRVLGELLETEEISDDESEANAFSLVEQPWAYARDAATRGETTALVVEDGSMVQVLRRDVYLHVDAARVKNVPSKWGRSITVIKLRISGLRQGVNQLRA